MKKSLVIFITSTAFFIILGFGHYGVRKLVDTFWHSTLTFKREFNKSRMVPTRNPHFTPEDTDPPPTNPPSTDPPPTDPPPTDPPPTNPPSTDPPATDPSSTPQGENDGPHTSKTPPASATIYKTVTGVSTVSSTIATSTLNIEKPSELTATSDLATPERNPQQTEPLGLLFIVTGVGVVGLLIVVVSLVKK